MIKWCGVSGPALTHHFSTPTGILHIFVSDKVYRHYRQFIFIHCLGILNHSEDILNKLIVFYIYFAANISNVLDFVLYDI